MKEEYWIGSNGPLTWNQVLYWVYSSINDVRREYDWRTRTWHYEQCNNPKGAYEINNYFSNYSHSDKDGTWTKGYWKEYGHWERECDPETKKIISSEYIIDERVWHDPKFTPKTFRVTDNFGRVIPSCAIIADYRNYTPNFRRDDYRKSYRSKYHTVEHSWEFRRDPVPDIHVYRKRCGRRYKGDHGFFGNEVRQTEVFKTELKDIKEELGVDVKYNAGRASDTWAMYTDWDCVHWHNKCRSWKHTRKRKQWM